MNHQHAFDQALRHHQGGQLQAAEAVCLQILRQQPTHQDAMHLLGIINYQVGRNDIAANLIRDAIALNPGWPEANVNLGNVLMGLKQIDQAIAAYRQAISLRPGYAEAYGNLGAALRENGESNEAIAAYRKAIQLRPAYPEAHSNLGTALKEAGQIDDAIASYRRAIALNPAFPEAHCNLGTALKEKGDLEDAIAAYRRAIALNPGHAEAWNNLGVALRETGELDAAIDAYQRAIAARPDYAMAFKNLGNALKSRGQSSEALDAYIRANALDPAVMKAAALQQSENKETEQADDALAACQQAVAEQPTVPELHLQLGVFLAQRGQLAEAIDAFRAAITLDPRSGQAHRNLANALRDAGEIDAAIAAYRQAIELDSNPGKICSNLGVVLLHNGRADEALVAFRQAMHFDPTDHKAHTNLILILSYHPAFDARAIAEELQRWNLQHARPLERFIQPHTNDRSPGRRLRIGYVSPDFCNHVVGNNLLPFFRRHDHTQFEIVCYAHVAEPDPRTRHFQQCADGWRNIVGLSDQQVVEQIRADRIDILVDLALHTAGNRGNRLLLFACKPAPVQVTFAGYPGSTGLTAIDYRLSDPYLDPVGMDDSIYIEKTVRLPHSFWCYDPLDQAGKFPVNELPAANNGFITFGSMNSFAKINDPVLALWARVLREVRNSRMVLLSPKGTVRTRTLEFLEREGIDPGRIEFVPQRSRQDYLETYRRIDIGLDSFPYNGHTTSLDSFWMGVPVITLVGQTIVGRAGFCQLSNLGLSELAAHDSESFVKIAGDLAADLPRLQQLRSSLRQRMEQSPLMDAVGFTKAIEAAYRQMWQNWCER